MNYEKASDKALDLRIFELKYGKLGSDKDMLKLWKKGAVSYCNNWADIGPIVVEHEITILFDGDSVEVSYDFEGVESVHGTDETLSYHISGNKKDVLRLVAICYLKMKEQEL